MRKILVFVLLACSTLFAAPKTYSPIHYRVALKLNLSEKSLEGREEISVRTLLPLKELAFDANEIEITSVISETALSSWSQRDGKLVILLKEEIPAGRSFKLRLNYHGKPTRGVSWGETSVRALYGTDHWMVCDFSPASIAKFDLELEFSVFSSGSCGVGAPHLPAFGRCGSLGHGSSPARLHVAASGRLINTRRRNGNLYSHWRQDTPVTPFVFGFAVGRMQESIGRAGRTSLRFLSEKHSPEQMAKIFSSTQVAIRFFEEKSGVELGPGTYTQVLTSGDPMQELAHMTVLPVDYGDDIEKDPSNLRLLVHELSHQWWAVRVPCADWADFWLNEGMANFMADAFVEQQFGKQAYAQAIEHHRQIYLKVQQDGKDRALYFPAWKKPQDASGPIAYHKGAYVLHLLRQEIGDQAFWSGLREYTRGHVGRLATTQDFQRSMEKASRMDLQSFFDQWVYGTKAEPE